MKILLRFVGVLAVGASLAAVLVLMHDGQVATLTDGRQPFRNSVFGVTMGLAFGAWALYEAREK